jgi:flagellar protein FlaG
MIVENVSSSGRSPNPFLQVGMTAQGRIPSGEQKKAAEGKKPLGLSQLAEVVTGMRNEVKGLRNVNLDFSVYEASGEIMVTVVDKDTGKVIREIPAKEALDLAAKLKEVVGLIFDKRA